MPWPHLRGTPRQVFWTCCILTLPDQVSLRCRLSRSKHFLVVPWWGSHVFWVSTAAPQWCLWLWSQRRPHRSHRGHRHHQRHHRHRCFRSHRRCRLCSGRKRSSTHASTLISSPTAKPRVSSAPTATASAAMSYYGGASAACVTAAQLLLLRGSARQLLMLRARSRWVNGAE